MGSIFRWVRELWQGKRGLGAKVPRAALAITIGTVPLFTVAGGRVKITQIFGEITQGVAATNTNIRLSHNPTVGTTTDLCADLNVISYALGDLLGITGVAADPMIPPASAGALEAQVMGVIVQEGTIDLISDATPATGIVQWTVCYIPIDDGATIA